MDISKIIIEAYEKDFHMPRSVDDVFEIDIEVREFVKRR